VFELKDRTRGLWIHGILVVGSNKVMDKGNFKVVVDSEVGDTERSVN
jgi:hypothetical protein